MKIVQLSTAYEISCNEISYRGLLRSIKKIPEATVIESSHDLMNDDTFVRIRYKDIPIILETPFSDYIIKCESSDRLFDEFISKLSSHKVRWWEKFF